MCVEVYWCVCVCVAKVAKDLSGLCQFDKAEHLNRRK